MNRTAHAILLAILLTSEVLGADSTSSDVQLQKERSLAEVLKKLVTCKNIGAFEDDGDLYCSLSFRGLQLEFAGVNRKGGGTIYVTALGKNQTVTSLGRRCIQIQFSDKDIRGIIDARILFRNDGVITHNIKNKNAWAECQ
jgi:hypothetical protein